MDADETGENRLMNGDKQLRKAGSGQIDSNLAPGMVVAMPQLSDPNFRRAVVLILRSNDKGAFGLVINRPGDLSVAELCKDQGIDYKGAAGEQIMVGGPVESERHLMVLHGEERLFVSASEEEIDVAPGIRLVTAREGLAMLAVSGAQRFRCFAGYAGWGPGQLEDELDAGAWIPLPADEELVFDVGPGAMVWEQALRRAGIDPISLVPGGAAN